MSFFHTTKCHYETLGVSVDASKEEIKRAYRRLCMETHPDVAGGSKSGTFPGSNQNVKRFQQIAEAHSILSNDKKRKQYDYERAQPRQFANPSSSSKDHFHRDWRGRPTKGNPSSSSSLQHEFLNGALRSRHILMGVFLGISAVSIINYISPSKKEDEILHPTTGQKQLIQAWKHPQTGKWHTPAPWDKTYSSLKPELQYVPRDQVITRNSSSNE